jgi:hypothetical protein
MTLTGPACIFSCPCGDEAAAERIEIDHCVRHRHHRGDVVVETPHGVAAFGAVYFAVQTSHAPQFALGVTLLLIGLSIAASAALLMWMRRAA